MELPRSNCTTPRSDSQRPLTKCHTGSRNSQRGGQAYWSMQTTSRRFLDRLDTAFLLGREWIAEFHLLSVHKTKPKPVSTSLTTLLTEYSDLFDISALLQINGFKAYLHIKQVSHF